MLTPSATTAMSQASMISQPPATAVPFTAAMIGLTRGRITRPANPPFFVEIDLALHPDGSPVVVAVAVSDHLTSIPAAEFRGCSGAVHHRIGADSYAGFMNRSRFVAVLIIAGVLVALVAAQLRSDDDTTAAQGATEASEAEPAAPRPIAGGEEARTKATAAATTSDPSPLGEAPPILAPKPDLAGLDGWLQSDATSLASFDGQVRIVQFWTFGCSNCKNTLPHLRALYAEHHDDGLEIIGVPSPEFDYEADTDNIAAAAVDLGVTWPIALDTEKVNFRAWQGRRRFWPRTYVLDQAGQVRFDHIGEGAYDELAETVEYLLATGASG